MAAQQTQVELAAAMGIGQDAISRLEGRSDVLLLTLRQYVEGVPSIAYPIRLLRGRFVASASPSRPREVKLANDLVIDGWDLFMPDRLGHPDDLVTDLSDNRVDGSIRGAHFADKYASKDAVAILVGRAEVVQRLLTRPCGEDDHLPGRGGGWGEPAALPDGATG